MNPYIPKVESYIKDTVDFLNIIPEKINPQSILFSFEVTNLYSVIQHDLGLIAVEHLIEKVPNLLHNIFSKDLVLKSPQLILENNFIHFNVMYKQKLGTALGTKVALNYDTLVPGYLEENYSQTFKTDLITTMKRDR